jgi:hypothetical protein
MKDKELSDKFIKLFIFNLRESDTNTESSDSINVIRQENTNEQATPYSEESNKNAARQRNINSQSGDRNVVIQSNDNRQTFHNCTPNYNKDDIARREIIRGRSSERTSRNFLDRENGSDNLPRYNENEEILDSELLRKHDSLTDWLNSSERTLSKTSVDEIDELLMNKKTSRSVKRTTIEDIQDLLFKNKKKYNIKDEFSLINKILYNYKMRLSKGFPHYNEDQLMKQVYDY